MNKLTKGSLLIAVVLALSACSLFAGSGGEELPPTEVHNVALNKTATASTKHSVYTPDLAIDGIFDNTASRWMSRGENGNPAPPHWLEVDLEGTFEITNATLYVGVPGASGPESAKSAPPSFKLQYWVDGAWADIPGAAVEDNPPGNGRVDLEFDSAVTTDKVRFESMHPSNIRVRELMVFGKLATQD